MTHELWNEHDLEIPTRNAGAAIGNGTASVLDVRLGVEWTISRLDGAVHVPLDELRVRLGELDAAATWLVICHHGVRSLDAANVLRKAGLRAWSIAGGMEAWSREIDPGVPRYVWRGGRCRLVDE